MTFTRLVFRSIFQFWKSNMLVAFGAAISTMVLTGTLIVGDSMRHSLEQSTELRLGKIQYAFSGIDRYFRAAIAEELQEQLECDVSAMLMLKGIASIQGSQLKTNNAQVLGIDEQFASMTISAEKINIPKGNEVHISENLAQRLQINTGDPLLLRVEKATLAPKNAPFVSGDDQYVSMRLKVDKILSNEQLGRFNLKISQTAPFNVFISLAFLNEQMEWKDKANTLLFAEGKSENEILDAIQSQWTLEDNSLNITSVNKDQNLQIASERVFIDSITTAKVKSVIPDAEPILTYMANAMSVNGKSTPYSFISAGPFSSKLEDHEILINSWMAEDLGAVKGDTVEVAYFSIGPLRKLIEKKHHFIIRDIVEMEGPYAEQKLMPDLPGLSDAGSCREWEAGVPISLDAIRDKDETYWNDYRGTPKAFIKYKIGKRLWQNRFGVCTVIWLPHKKYDIASVRKQISSAISPADLGYRILAVKMDGLRAARGGVDFSQLFMGLSFFLLLAAIILMSLLFDLHLDKRIGEIGTLKALGFNRGLIRRLFLFEGLLIAIPGLLSGIVLAILYNKLVFVALSSVWQEIVLTTILIEAIVPLTLLVGGLVSLVIISLTVWSKINRKLKTSSSDLHKAIGKQASPRQILLSKIIATLVLLLAAGLLISDFTATNRFGTGIYFTAGALILPGLLLMFNNQLGKKAKNLEFNWRTLMSNNISRNKKRSMSIMVLFALGTFITISTGLNQKNLYKNAQDRSSGTGGFQFYMETTLPILADLNDSEAQLNMGIDPPMKFLQMRKSEGDDASCLNLNRVSSPRILGVKSDLLEHHFTFVSQTADLDPEQPWASLKKKLPGNVVPAIMDQTVIQWGLGKSVGDTLIYRNELGGELYLKIIGGLANSIFQGNVLIDEAMFLEHFPSSSGTHVILAEDNEENTEERKAMLSRAFRNEGLEVEIAAERLAKFNQVENTYLSIFLLLGGLALILGTVGLGISLARNIMDRSNEFGVLGAIGLRKKQIFSLITFEHLILLSLGTLIGAVSAFIATLPSLISGLSQNSFLTALFLIMAILINGFIWITMISRSFLRKNLIAAIRME